MEILRSNQLWVKLEGPRADTLFNPSRHDLERCNQCVEDLGELQHRDENIDDAFASEVRRAVGMLKSLAWDDIREERFPLTPQGLYVELVRNAEKFLNKHGEEKRRREAWLARDDGNEERGFVPLCRKTVDKYGLDLDEFKNKTGKRLPVSVLL